MNKDTERKIKIALGVKLLHWKRGKYRPDGGGVAAVGTRFKRVKVGSRWVYRDFPPSNEYPFMSPDGDTVYGYNIPPSIRPRGIGSSYDPFNDIEDAWVFVEALKPKYLLDLHSVGDMYEVFFRVNTKYRSRNRVGTGIALNAAAAITLAAWNLVR